MKKLLLLELLLIPILGFTGCMALQKPMDNMMGVNPKTGCAYGANCSQVPNSNISQQNQINKTLANK